MHLKWSDPVALRELAEKQIVNAGFKTTTREDRATLLHELLLHRTELEMQNEALHEAQGELQQSEERYRNLFEDAPVGYVLLDGACRIKVANQRAAALLGAGVERLRRTQLQRYLVPEDAVGFEHYRREMARSTRLLTAEFTVMGLDRRRRELRFEGLRVEGQRGDCRLTMTDVTERNEIARQLNHSERLGALGRHASSVAHDLNNLLHSVMGHAEIALRFLTPKDPAYTPMLRLREVVHRCSEATSQLATFTRADTSQPGLLDLNAAIASKEAELRSLLGDFIELEMRLDASDGIVRVDEEHVHQILLNVVRNARQAMPHGGAFLIETESTERTVAPDSLPIRFVRWSMSDSGVGMDAATRSRALEPFFTTKPPGVGTGLGLALVAAVVERASGMVTLESELGRGTKVSIELPCAPGTASLERAAAASPSPIVMIVTEHSALSARLGTILCAAGCSIVRAGGESDALARLEELADTLNVLLVDDRLPEAVIGELLRVVRALSPFTEVIVAPLDAEAGEGAETPLDVATRLTLAAVQRQRAQ